MVSLLGSWCGAWSLVAHTAVWVLGAFQNQILMGSLLSVAWPLWRDAWVQKVLFLSEFRLQGSDLSKIVAAGTAPPWALKHTLPQVFCNIGNPHAVQQKPITFYRQAGSDLLYCMLHDVCEMLYITYYILAVVALFVDLWWTSTAGDCRHFASRDDLPQLLPELLPVTGIVLVLVPSTSSSTG